MGGVDLDLFQFDWDMTWAALFLNADLTIYGRYGSRRDNRAGSAALLSMPSLANAMKRALEVHAGYPANKESLKAKRGKPQPWNRPGRIPSLPDHARRARPPLTCVHCHHVPVGIKRSLIEKKRLLTDEQVWVFPFPENMGVEIDVSHGHRVAKVVAGSPAARAGLEAGDVFEAIDGQPIGSIADIQWVLHGAPRKADLAVEVTRGGRRVKNTVALDGAWKEMDISWRASTWTMRPGLKVADVPDAQRERLRLPLDTLALRVERVLRNHPNKQRGFKKGDILLEVGGRADRWDESRFVAHLRQTHRAGSKVPVRLLRKGKRIRHVLRIG